MARKGATEEVVGGQEGPEGPPLRTGCRRFGHTERLYYGRPFTEAVLTEADRGARDRIFLLTTRSLATSKMLSDMTTALGSKLAGVYSGLAAHSPRKTVLAAAREAHARKADMLVALGGGSVIDGAKAVQLCLWTNTTDSAALDRLQNLRAHDIVLPAQPQRMVAVPTTLSGAEFTDFAGISNAQGRKESFAHPLMAPLAIILDPIATRATPSRLFLSTGMRCIDHAVETICSPHCDILSETAARRGLGLLATALQRNACNPDDLGARQDCQFGLWLAATGPAGGVPMGASHGIGHILGAEFGLPHGITSCVMMAAVLTWNRSVNVERQRLVEDSLPLEGSTAAEKITTLLATLKLPRRLSDVGIGAKDFPHIAARAMTDFFIPTNPRPIRGPEDIMEILRLAA